MDIARALEQILSILDEDRLVASLEEVSAAAVTPVVVTGIIGEQLLHPAAKSSVGRFDEEMRMGWHEAERVGNESAVADQTSGQPQELGVVFVIVKDSASAHSSGHDVTW